MEHHNLHNLGSCARINTGLLEWVSDDCPLRALCIPTEHGRSFCSCRFWYDMFEDGDGKCLVTTATNVYWAFWLFISFLSLSLFLWMSFILISAKIQHVLTKDNLGVTALLTTTTNFLITISSFSRGMLTQITESRDHYNWWNQLFLACELIVAFTLFTGLVFFGLSSITALIQAIHRPVAFDRHRVIAAAFFAGSVVVLAICPLLALHQYVLATLVESAVGISCWIMFRKIARDLWRSVPQSQQSIQVNTYISVNYRQTIVSAPSRLLYFVNNSTNRVLVVLCLTFVFNSMFVLVWYIGRSMVNELMLRELNAIAYALLRVTIFGLQLAMSQTIVSLFQVRFETRVIQLQAITQETRSAAYPVVLFARDSPTASSAPSSIEMFYRPILTAGNTVHVPEYVA
eukprot:c4829_g1_i1.p1 GENE.c4829_g1_i1~~c4829_g1_i1.p1  ORF type:complete len:402 (-),score=20.03 c4829_g1_i1:91-1296(-)